MATGAQEHIDATTAAVFIEQIYSKDAIVAREQALVFAPLVERKYEDEMEMGGSIVIPSRGHLTTQTKNTSSNAATVFETVTETNTTVTVGTWSYSAISLETFTKKQSNRDLMAFYAPEQGYALGLAVDATLAGHPDDFSQTVGTLATDCTYDQLLRADQYLNDANAPQEDRVIVISPAQKAGFMKIDQFTSADYAKLGGDVLSNPRRKSAYLGTWAGTYDVWMSTHVEGSNTIGHDNAMFQKSAIACVLQLKATTHAMFDINYLANKVVVEQIYGDAELRDDHGVWIATL